MNCPNCEHEIEILGVQQLAAVCGTTPRRMGDRASKRNFPAPDGELGGRRDFWIKETILPKLHALGLIGKD